MIIHVSSNASISGRRNCRNIDIAIRSNSKHNGNDTRGSNINIDIHMMSNLNKDLQHHTSSRTPTLSVTTQAAVTVLVTGLVVV